MVRLSQRLTMAQHAVDTAPSRASSAAVRVVFVNGIAVLRDGGHTGAKPGHIVRGPGLGR